MEGLTAIDSILLQVPVEVNKLPRAVASSIECYQRDNYSATKGNILTVHEAIDYYLTWNGFINYTDSLIFMFMSIMNEGERNANLKSVKGVMRHG